MFIPGLNNEVSLLIQAYWLSLYQVEVVKRCNHISWIPHQMNNALGLWLEMCVGLIVGVREEALVEPRTIAIWNYFLNYGIRQEARPKTQ